MEVNKQCNSSVVLEPHSQNRCLLITQLLKAFQNNCETSKQYKWIENRIIPTTNTRQIPQQLNYVAYLIKKGHKLVFKTD